MTEGCSEPGCVFYDDFNGDQLDECRWQKKLGCGNPVVRDGKLELSRGHCMTSRAIDGASDHKFCPSKAIIEYKAKLEGSGIRSSIFNFGDLEVFLSESGYFLSCNPEYGESVQVSYLQWHTIRIDSDGSKANLYINDSLKQTIACNVKYAQGPDIYGPPEDSPILFIDYILEKCE